MSNDYLVTWGGYYVHVCPEDKGWVATISQLGDSARPGERKPRTVRAATEDEVLEQARLTIDQTPRL